MSATFRQASSRLSLLIVSSAIVVVLAVIIYLLTRPPSTPVIPAITQTSAIKRPPSVASLTPMPPGSDLAIPATISQTTDIATEISDFMAAMGIEDQLGDNVEVYTEQNIEALSLQNDGQTAPPPGLYRATAIYEQGRQKDLDALRAAGFDITLTINADGTATGELLGLTLDGSYDDHYFYDEDHEDKFPYLYTDGVITISAHRLEADLVPAEYLSD